MLSIEKYGTYYWTALLIHRLISVVLVLSDSVIYAFWIDTFQGFKPSKYFSIDRVFRNETLDATHLAEFHQVEGVIADYNLTLGDLIGMLKWYSKEKFCSCN
jgi:hypothetical protein